MQNYPIGQPYMPQTPPIGMQTPQANSGATLNIGTGTPGSIPVNGANGVTINIIGASVNPNGANIYNSNTAPTAPGQAYGKDYYINQPAQTTPQTPTVPIGSQNIGNNTQTTNEKQKTKEIVLLTDEYIKTLENYIRNSNPDIKLMGAKELMKRFREDESRKNDPALTSLLNLVLQSRYSPVKMVGMGILQGGWAQGDAFTQQLLAQIQQSKGGYGLDAIDAANAALKTAGKTVKVPDNSPTKTDKK